MRPGPYIPAAILSPGTSCMPEEMYDAIKLVYGIILEAFTCNLESSVFPRNFNPVFFCICAYVQLPEIIRIKARRIRATQNFVMVVNYFSTHVPYCTVNAKIHWRVLIFQTYFKMCF